MNNLVPIVKRFKAFQGSAPFLMSLVKGNLGTNILQGDISEITYVAVDVGTEVVLDEGTIDKATTVFDTVVTPEDDPRWKDDSVGYNFGWQAPPDVLVHVAGGKSRVEIKFTPGVGYPFHIVFLGETVDLLSVSEESSES